MKIIRVLITFFLLISLTNVNYIKAEETEPDSDLIDANVVIKYDKAERKIKVSNAVLFCNGGYYGIHFNSPKAINYDSRNNGFITEDGTQVEITRGENKTGINEADTYTSIQKIDKNVYLTVKASDKEKAEEIFDNLFKTTGYNYRMFDHDINDEWTKEVVITEDAISFSNKERTIYIYQNDGSPVSNGVDTGFEPTVFMKQLRGIDIPITYPEDNSDPKYIPYSIKEYEPVKVNGYIPFSAYDLTTQDASAANYIILAETFDDLHDLFERKNEHHQHLVSLKTDKTKIDYDAKVLEKTDISHIREYAEDIVMGDNRYHLGFLKKTDEEQHFTAQFNGAYVDLVSDGGYYIDYSRYALIPDAYTRLFNNAIPEVLEYTTTITNKGDGKIVMPTIKKSTPLNAEGYGGTFSMEFYTDEEPWLIGNHGAAETLCAYLKDCIRTNSGFSLHLYIMNGDYIYYYSSDYVLHIFKCVGSSETFGVDSTKPDVIKYHEVEYAIPTFYEIVTKKMESDLTYDLVSNSCYAFGEDALNKAYRLETKISY